MEQLGYLKYLLMGTPSLRGALRYTEHSVGLARPRRLFNKHVLETGEPGGDLGFHYCSFPKELLTLLPAGTG